MRNGFPQNIEDLRIGDHICQIFEHEEDRRAVVVPFILIGLERGEKTLYITDAHTSGQILDHLMKKSSDVSACIKSGQFSIIPRGQSGGKIGGKIGGKTEGKTGGKSGPDANGIISFIREETEAALAEGYSALRIINDMDWACRLTDFEQLVEHLAMTCRLISSSKCLVLCQFNREYFLPAMLQSILNVYPIVIIDKEIYNNSCHLPPDAFQQSDLPELMLNNLIDSLKERKRLDQALREEKRRSRLILDNSPHIFFSHDRDLRYTWIYDPSRKLRLSEEETVGKTDYEITPSEESRRLMEIKRAVLESGTGERQEVRITRDYDVFFYDLAVEPLKDDKGEIAGVACAAVDITERKQADEALRESEARFKGIYESSPIGIELYDPEGKLIHINKACMDIFGVEDVEDVFGFRLFDDPNLPADAKGLLLRGDMVKCETVFDFEKV
ncbi:MAG TPA: MEDS domain-containing protein, partial [Methanotrichaceae archaeon]|nr:MEDS domain-containing protein [Methanotrichaceae archaeon]